MSEETNRDIERMLRSKEILLDFCSKLDPKYGKVEFSEGIDENEIQLIIQPFYMADKSRSRADGGAGLGLTLVKLIMEKHGGILKIESTKGKGSSFSLIFPQK